MMNRRQFLEKSGHGAMGTALLVATATSSTFLLGGCSLESAIKTWVPVVRLAFGGILTVLESAGLFVPGVGTAIGIIATMIKAGFDDVLGAIDQWNKAPAASKATFLGKISTFLAALRDNFGKFWTDLKLPGGSIVGLIKGVSQVIMDAIASFLGQLPTPVTTAVRYSVAGGPEITSAVSKKMDLNDFKKQFNAVVSQYGHPEIALH